jgi:hypothetical protein
MEVARYVSPHLPLNKMKRSERFLQGLEFVVRFPRAGTEAPTLYSIATWLSN